MPSKKVLSVLILTIALVAAIIIAFGRDKSSEAINFASNLVAGEKISIPENPNWQKELGGVSANTILVQKEESTSTPETATDTISRTLVANYLALKQSGTLNQTSVQKLIDQTINLTDELGSTATSDTKLNIIPDNGRQSMIDYGENLGNILKNNKPKEPQKALDIFTQILQSENPSKLNELDDFTTTYEKISSEFVKMPVPQTFVKAHLDLTNSIKNGATALTKMKLVFSDPFKSLLAVQSYQNNITTFTQAMQAIILFLKQNNVVYKQGSGGYYLLYGI
jgi:hypothetical protein